MDKYGIMRVGAAVPNVKVGDPVYNERQIVSLAAQASEQGIEVIVTPELSITGYTCADLFNQPLLLEAAKETTLQLADDTKEMNVMIVVGLPVVYSGRRYNCGVVIYQGEIVGIVPKSYIPNYSEFYEKRWFTSGRNIKNAKIEIAGKEVPFGTDLLFSLNGAKVGIEICEDLWVPVPPSSLMCQQGADIILNLSASDELIGKHRYLLSLIAQQSGRCRCGYVYSSCGWGESSTDLVFVGKGVVAVDGNIRAESARFSTEPMLIGCNVDVERLRTARMRFDTFFDGTEDMPSVRIINLNYHRSELKELEEYVDPLPFVPADAERLREHCEEIINIQSQGLMQRLNAIRCDKVVIGISGGLDSTLALLVAVRAFDRLGLDRKGIIGITMPGMATTSRTHNNATGLMEELGVTSLEIPIGKAVAQHFQDIGQDPDVYDVTYENSQARERTQILMDYANKVNAIVVGTGDMSELALGWATYNGDHMSMYGVNASVPKTLVRHLVRWFSGEFSERCGDILMDIVDTPISPELVPSGSDDIAQKTEDLVGPYELHDFYLYHLLRNSFSPRKTFMLARRAFRGEYNDGTILKWLKTFYRRFFNQQFKRSCMPDGPKVGNVCLSPRGDWRMPSDATVRLWLAEIEQLENEL